MGNQRTLGSVIKLLTPSPDYGDEYNRWLESLPSNVVSLTLLGVAIRAPNRSTSRGFLLSLAGVAVALVLLESGGRLWWRWAAPDVWTRTADADGSLRQSCGFTCAPAAAVMLLARFGVLPTDVPSWDEVISALTQPDDGRLLFGALTMVGGVDVKIISARFERIGVRLELLPGGIALALDRFARIK